VIFLQALEQFLREKTESGNWKEWRARPRVWSYSAEGGRAEVLRTQLEIPPAELKASVFKALLSTELACLELDLKNSGEFKGLDGKTLVKKSVTGGKNGFTAWLEVHRRK